MCRRGGGGLLPPGDDREQQPSVGKRQAARQPPRPHFQTPTNYHQKTKETTRPTERNVTTGEN